MIRLLDLFPLHTRVLRAFGGGRCARRQMHATIGQEKTRKEKSCLRASSEAGGECLGLRAQPVLDPEF